MCHKLQIAYIFQFCISCATVHICCSSLSVLPAATINVAMACGAWNSFGTCVYFKKLNLRFWETIYFKQWVFKYNVSVSAEKLMCRIVSNFYLLHVCWYMLQSSLFYTLVDWIFYGFSEVSCLFIVACASW